MKLKKVIMGATLILGVITLAGCAPHKELVNLVSLIWTAGLNVF